MASFGHFMFFLFVFLHLGTFRHFLLLYWTFSSFDTFPPYVLPLLGTSLHLLALFPRIFWQMVGFLNNFWNPFLPLFFWLFGTVWHFSEHFGTFWHAIKIQKRPEIKDMAHLIFIFICVGPIWTILDQFGPNSTHLDPFALFFFTKLELFGNMWSSFELFGAFWSYLETFEAVWSQV